MVKTRGGCGEEEAPEFWFTCSVKLRSLACSLANSHFKKFHKYTNPFQGYQYTKTVLLMIHEQKPPTNKATGASYYKMSGGIPNAKSY